jgi:hypothetical protein
MANDNFKIVVEWSLANGSVAQNVIYANIPGGDAANPSDLVNDIVNLIAAKFANWLAEVITTVILNIVKVYGFDEATGLSVPIGSGLIGDPGTATGVPCPAGCAVKVNIYPDLRARPAGIYLPQPAAVSLNTDGTLDAPGVANAALTAAQLVGGSTLGTTGLSWNPRYWSKKDLAMVDIEGAPTEVNDVVDYQRRRKKGVGI